ncbi:MAG: hypothetical protein WC438_02100 [Candidatus Pacearchaeota archaeon]
MENKEVKDILEKYSNQLKEQVENYDNYSPSGEQVSREFEQFKQDMMPELSKFERWAANIGGIIKLKIATKDEEKIQKELDNAHLNVSPGEVVGLAIAGFLGFFFLGILISVAIWLFSGESLINGFPLLFLFLMLVASFFIFYYFYSQPSRLATKWRLKASSQMVPAILYTVIYMKHTSNLERAISFVAQNVEEPLSLDLRKVIWDVETGRYSTIKESLDSYLDSWREHSMEFVESFHLIESSLYEPSEARRIQILERALKVILDGVYEKMLKYTHEIKSPLTNIYMLGIVLPTLGLALLPLASTLLSGAITWVHVFLIFNLIIPFLVFYLTSQIMLQRPGGYGETSLLERNPLYYEYSSKSVYFTAFAICLPFFLLGILPLIFGYTPVPAWLGLPSDFNTSTFAFGIFGDKAFGFLLNDAGDTVGPFGLIGLLLSLLVPFSVAMFFSLSFSFRTRNLIKARNDSKDLEKEFNSSLFTLGNRLGDGTPAEIAFARVAESVKGQKTEDFFRIVNSNIQSMGMSIENAIFNPTRGALIYYPSTLIATSMRILVESVKKGLRVAAESLMSISEYVRNIQKINERLRDLLADVVSDMKSNMTFLAPLLAGIVVGLSAMITGILGMLEGLMGEGGAGTSIAGIGDIGSITTLFNIKTMIPPYFLQIAIGIYLVQIVFILTATLTTVDSGEDKLKQTYDISKNLIRGTILYLVTGFISIIALSVLAWFALKGLGAG